MTIKMMSKIPINGIIINIEDLVVLLPDKEDIYGKKLCRERT